MLRWLRIATVLTLSLVATTQADEYATLSGRFVFDGQPPEPKELDIKFDKEICGKQRDESLLVHPKDRGIANVVIQLYLTIKEKPPVHPRLEELRKSPLALTMEGCRIQPRISLILTEQRYRLINKDPVGHALKIDLRANAPPSDLIPGNNQDITKMYLSPERFPSRVDCVIHPWMQGYLIVSDHPYVAVSDTSGNFSIPDLPPGTYTFRVWHERSKFIENVSREGQAKTWAKGRFTVKLTPGEVKLGEIKVPASEFPD